MRQTSKLEKKIQFPINQSEREHLVSSSHQHSLKPGQLLASRIHILSPNLLSKDYTDKISNLERMNLISEKRKTNSLPRLVRETGLFFDNKKDVRFEMINWPSSLHSPTKDFVKKK